MFVVLVAEMDEGGLDIGEESFEGGNGAFLWRVGIVERTGFCRGHYGVLFEESGLFNLGLEFDVQVVVDFCKHGRRYFLFDKHALPRKFWWHDTRYVVLGNELIRNGVRVSRLVPNLEIFLYYTHFRLSRPVNVSIELRNKVIEYFCVVYES